ncbi:endonuclease III, putative [Trichomonas vaginalis G3]|uniref:Endonuclease III, putative n=1 Tax=Trichomonas vaginalis (strain ATCC PRA-98 / G3) TaxID=412133 RepID=A2DVT6_TRIV3|nr:oxidized pyrimidine nucleobase lesion DNA N-glycosylase protein [Trichomonas vaginalis G3]EAY15499.1 endonuclease III, putative [Trichomonas vaginalis G3]KAI5511510.1 oxidized pyrimidine nucleobase lesion DNA N-glycosylase protein [Trichomonas vaginalis G3]|eukprot:XP_001327722.1 endonuclease III [Trichomonas vaginalis G3]
MSEAWNESTGITVDTHVHRLANRLHFVKTNNPNATSQKLSEIIDKDLWKDASQAFYYYGQQICQAKKPQCDDCIISDCPSRK